MKTEKNIPESLLMAYLYDEMNAAEKEQVEKYLAANPEAAAELRTLQDVRKKLSAIPDKEVIIPALDIPSQKHASDTRLIKTLLAIAASVAIILVSGWLTGTHISWAENELRISFGYRPEQSGETPLTTEQVQNMIDQTLHKSISGDHEATLEATLTEQQIRNWVSAYLATALNNQQSKELNHEKELQQYTAALYAENARLMREFINQSAREQQQAIEEMLIDYTEYMNRQRQNDLQALYVRLNALEQNTELYKQETDQLLTGIMASVTVPVREVRN